MARGRSELKCSEYAAVVLKPECNRSELLVKCSLSESHHNNILKLILASNSRWHLHSRIQDAVLSVFDLRPAAIIRDLDLLRPIYSLTSAYGHFGRELAEFTWEKTDRAAALQAAIK